MAANQTGGQEQYPGSPHAPAGKNQGMESGSKNSQVSGRMPALFIGHGNPMNAVEDNEYSRAWRELGEKLPAPRAILSISAHWYVGGTRVHEGREPMTIHDFMGFPEELYRIRYPCPGAPELAWRIESMIKSARVKPDLDWGLDHGTWVPLLRLFPQADIPVLQLSIDEREPGAFHYGLGLELAPLRDEGVLIMGSGNIVHNLGAAKFDGDAKPYGWAVEFDRLAAELIAKRDHESLVNYRRLGPQAMLSIPRGDHYWPLLYVLGTRGEDEEALFPVTGIAHSSVSMRAVAFGI